MSVQDLCLKKIITRTFCPQPIAKHLSFCQWGRKEQSHERKVLTPVPCASTRRSKLSVALTFALTRSLGWWLCPTAKQTVIHMSPCAGPVFIWSSSTEAPLKAKELRGQGFKAAFYLATMAITVLLVSPFICGGSGKDGRVVYLCQAVRVCFDFQGWEDSDNEVFPSMAQSVYQHRLLSDFCILRRHIRTFTGVSRLQKKTLIIWRNMANISAVHRDRSLGDRCR